MASSCGDGMFGPAVYSQACRGGFDYTSLFEESILNILPSAIFLVLGPLRIAHLHANKRIVTTTWIYWAKLATAACLVVWTSVLLGLISNTSVLSARPTRIAAVALDLAAALLACALCHFEHIQSPRPSFLICSWLVITVLLDSARTRTAWLAYPDKSIPGLMLSSVLTKSAFLVLESAEKRNQLLGDAKSMSREMTSGLLSRGFFFWLNGLLRSGYRTVLSTSSLPAINERLATAELAERFERAWKTCEPNHAYSLVLVIAKALKWELLKVVLPRLCVLALAIAQPFIINEAVTFISLPDTSATQNMGYGLIGAVALVFIGSALATSWYEHIAFRAMTMLRGGLISMIFGTMVALPIDDVSESSAMSLMGSDVETLAEVLDTVICELWASFVQLPIAIFLLVRQLEAVAVVPVIIAILFTGVSLSYGRFVSQRQKTWLESMQSRLNFTTEILGSIKSVKMLGLTAAMTSLIEQRRAEEIAVSRRYRYLQSFNVCWLNLPESIGQLVVFGAYALVAKVSGAPSLSVTQAITALSIISLLNDPLAILLYAIPQCFNSLGCMARIRDFLLQPHRQERRLLDLETRETRERAAKPERENALELDNLTRSRLSEEPSAIPSVAISLRGASFSWTTSARNRNAIDLEVPMLPNGYLVMVIGPVGSGKSTLLKGLLGETPHLGGEVSLPSNRVAFCDQTTWLLNGTIRSNIVADTSQVDKSWYKTVVAACALDADLEGLPEGDLTLVGSRGVKLSGGQKQRIALARALYSRNRIVLLDDIFSGLDNTTEQTVFDGVFGTKGLLRHIGATTILTTHSVRHLPSADHILALEEGGRIVEQGTFETLKIQKGYVQALEVSQTNGAVNSTEKQPVPPRGEEAKTQGLQGSAAAADEDHQSEKKGGTLAVYKYYLQALGPWKVTLFLLFLCIDAAFRSIQFLWLSNWSSSNSASDLGYWLGVFAGFTVLGCIGLIGGVVWAYSFIVPAASENLHSVVLKAAMSAPMSYLASIETGVLVNRFGQDMRLVDMVLPRNVVVAGFQGLSTIGSAGLAMSAVGYAGATVPLILLVVIVVQRFYLRTSRQLRLLEIETKAPLFSHFIESLNGLATIRAFGRMDQFTDKTLALLDEAQRPYYLLLCLQRWLLLVLKLTVAGLAILIMGLAVKLRATVEPGLLGIALVMMMSMGTSLSGFINNWTLLETSLGAVARIRNFATETPSETDSRNNVGPVPSWPTQGAIEYDNVSVRYSNTSDPVLRGISMSIKPGQKIGLCGRTGSGKSSFIMSLLSLADVCHGRILVDSVDLATVPPALLRQRLSCLTQEPFTFTSSVRLNADPSGQRTDAEIIKVLNQIGLWRVIVNKVSASDPETPGTNPLDATLDGNFLSHGQRQAFCLARAMLKKSNVLILDEPTSSVDRQLDAEMQAIIRSEFSHCTIIMIAHRLDSLLDFDRVAVMDGGRLVEFGPPQELLKRDGYFSKLYTGS
ncbi:P-loop containing nucleoside triphosphate hydrolase protein [Cryphonectria parasitica EP155]|uniref:P-loop containing nucleoside triphosphate hydrolase protein n=1 Tax=Cryphonectria parasitica (strain ATCC 38755 / EP155) TaxID=660469 RepID=A0A9P4XSF7_CRYP1|nr:P-loop containing nucleoside triphosphate hydrolase protein [Cryphonectria parasitica EP155]KAF3760028.1 P-loop containing nucleoside triphosphate hydrolase protein [Cryphonectria parasitica EP155]